MGDGGVGKSAIILQFIQKTFIPDHDPTIEDNYNKHWEIDGKICLLNGKIRSLYINLSSPERQVWSLVLMSDACKTQFKK